jgi:hypothetical protein
MGKQVFWETEYEEASEAMIALVEIITKLQLPQEYLPVARKYQGGYPSLRNLDVEGYGVTVFEALLTFLPFDDYDIIEAYNTVRSRGRFEFVFPFAMTFPYSFYCFDYRENKEKPPLVYWNREMSKLDPQNAVTEFLEKVY